MDADRFDTLIQSLSTAGSRRGVLAAIVGGSLGLLGWHTAEDADAHNAATACKKKSGKAKKKCLKKAKAHNATHATQASPPPPPQPPVCTSSCTNGRTCQNGTCACPAGMQFCTFPNRCQVCCSNVDCCNIGENFQCPPGSQTCQASGTCGVSCTDNVHNGNETDVDCGGSCPRRCADGKGCVTNNDCLSARCITGTCLPCSSGQACGVHTDGGTCFCLTAASGENVCRVSSGTPSVANCGACPPETVCFTSEGVRCYKPCGAP